MQADSVENNLQHLQKHVLQADNPLCVHPIRQGSSEEFRLVMLQFFFGGDL